MSSLGLSQIARRTAASTSRSPASCCIVVASRAFSSSVHPSAEQRRPPGSGNANASSSAHTNSNSNANAEESSRAAFRQRQILDSLRAHENGGSASGGGGALAGANAQQPRRPMAAAEAALSGGSAGGVGPFPMGMLGDAGSSVRSAQGGVVSRWIGEGKSWSELQGGQKVARATVRTSSFLLILGGGALTAVLAYALATELFARNSPTVIFGDACKRVEQSPEIHAHLLPPYRFHTSSSSTTSSSPLPSRARRNRHVSTAIIADPSTGTEVLLLRFFLEARDKDTELRLYDRARASVIEAAHWTWEKGEEAVESLREWAGVPAEEKDHRASEVDRVLPSASSVENREQQSGNSWLSLPRRAFSATFGSLAGLAQGGADALGKVTANRPELGTWSSGEAHAEMEKDENGVFQYKHLFVDVPSSSAAMHTRVWIVRREGEVVR